MEEPNVVDGGQAAGADPTATAVLDPAAEAIADAQQAAAQEPTSSADDVLDSADSTDAESGDGQDSDAAKASRTKRFQDAVRAEAEKLIEPKVTAALERAERERSAREAAEAKLKADAEASEAVRKQFASWTGADGAYEQAVKDLRAPIPAVSDPYDDAQVAANREAISKRNEALARVDAYEQAGKMAQAMSGFFNEQAWGRIQQLIEGTARKHGAGLDDAKDLDDVLGRIVAAATKPLADENARLKERIKSLSENGRALQARTAGEAEAPEGGGRGVSNGRLTVDAYLAMSPAERAKVRRENLEAVNAMFSA